MVRAGRVQRVVPRDSADRDPAWRFAFATLNGIVRAKHDPAWGRAMLRLSHDARADSAEISRYLRDDLMDGHAQGHFRHGPDDVTVDTIVGLILMATQRMVCGEADPGYPERVVERLLTMLGGRPRSAARIVSEAMQALPAVAAGESVGRE